MSKPHLIRVFVPAKESTTSDSQVGAGSDTAGIDNLAAIMRNNVIVFHTPVIPASETIWIPAEKDIEQSGG